MKSIEQPQVKKSNPYKGLQSYEEEDKENFYGRKEEAEHLYHLVLFNFLTVVYGKAGFGKTSLLNAGLFPMLRKAECHPIRVRFNYADQAPSLVEQIHSAILGEISHAGIVLIAKNTGEPAEPISTGENLSDYFQRVKHVDHSGLHPLTLVLVFDQFEEIFTLGANHRDKDNLISVLFSLIENQSPDSPTSSSSEKLLDVRVIISLREDYLPQFIELKSRVTAIDKAMFRVSHLNGTQAREIIRMPGGLWEEDKIHEILRRFYPEPLRYLDTVPDEKLEIEPVFLSLLCHQLFENKEHQLTSLTEQKQNKIIENYYNSTIKEFPPKVERFIESNLLTKGGFRTPYPLAQEQRLKEYIPQLVEKRIIRKEYWGGTEYIEIIHDLLIPIIKEKRSRRTKRTNKFIIAGLSILLLFFIGLSWYALNQKNRADEQYKNSRELTVISEALMEFSTDNTRAIRIAENAFKMGLPNPQGSTYRILSTIGYSSQQRPFYIAVLNHQSPVYTAVFSPDGNQVLTAGEDGTARVWNMDQTLMCELKKHTARILSASFSPDGSKILTASWDKTALLWDSRGNILATLKGHKGPVTSAVFSPDGARILTASRDNTAKLWDIQGNILANFTKHTAPVVSAVFSPGGSQVLTASWDNTARLWGIKGEPLVTISHNGAVSSAVFSADGQRILTASWDKTARLSDLKGNKLIEFNKDYNKAGYHKEAVISAVLSPDQASVLTASRDNTAILWNRYVPTTKVLEHDSILEFAGISPDGNKIVTTSRDGILKLWDLEGNLLLELNQFNGKVYQALFSPDGNRLLTACEDGTAVVWSLDTNLLVNINKHQKAVNSAVFSPDGSKVLTASDDQTAKVVDLTGNLQAELNIDKGKLKSAVFSPDGTKILTVAQDQIPKIWDSQGKFLRDLVGHTDVITSAVFSNDSQKILTASEDGTARVWNLEGTSLLTLKKHSNAVVLSAVFSPGSRLVLTASMDKTAKVSNMDGKTIANLDKHNDAVNSAIFSPNGERIVTASRDGTAKIWDLAGNMLVDLKKHRANVISAVFSPDNRFILTGSEDGTAIVWTQEGQVQANLDRHKSALTFTAFSPDGKRVITTSADRTAKLWDLTGNLLANLDKHTDIVTSAGFSPDGKRIVTASRDKTAKIYYTPETIAEWLKTAKIPPLSQMDKNQQ